MNSWGDSNTHIDIGGNTPFTPVWNNSGAAGIMSLPQEMENESPFSPLCLASLYARVQVEGSAIDVTFQTNEGYTESGNPDIGGVQQAYVKNWLFGVRATGQFENLDTFVVDREDMKVWGFNAIGKTRHGRGRIRSYASSKAVLLSNKYQNGLNSVMLYNTTDLADQLVAQGDFDCPTAADLDEATYAPKAPWCWSLYFKPDLIIPSLDANINSTPVLVDVTLTMYCKFTIPNQRGPLQQNTMECPANFNTPPGYVTPGLGHQFRNDAAVFAG